MPNIIGTAPNQVPTNADLGSMAFQNNEAVSIGTLSLSSLTTNPTLSSGTANGVAYLDGSKVLTTGSALTFNGTAFTTTGSATAAALIPSGATVPTNGLFLPAANTIGLATNSAERMRIDSSGNLLFNSGYGSVATAYGCRAWVNFNGTGTVAIRASGNVSSITDNGAGDYIVNFTTAMPNTNYAVGGFAIGSSSTVGTIPCITGEVEVLTTSGCPIRIRNFVTNNWADAYLITAAFFR